MAVLIIIGAIVFTVLLYGGLYAESRKGCGKKK